MVEVEIQGIVVTHQYGTLNTGDVLRTDSAFAKHLVEDCGAAKYRDAPVKAPESEPAAQAPEAAAGVGEPAAAAEQPPVAAPAPRRGRTKQ